MASEPGIGSNPPEAPRSVVVVTGAAGALGRRACELALADPSVGRVVAVDRRPVPGLPPSVQVHQADLASADLKPLFEGADVLLHLAQADAVDAEVERPAGVVGDGQLAHRVLDAASAVGVQHVVLLSSATAYGAWANNPVPLTEEAPLRPNPGVAFAAEKSELERAAADWRDDHPGATVAVLRPTVTVRADGTDSWLARALSRTSPLPVTAEEPPAQFLDLVDLAAAVDLARRAGLDGPRNVAPDGWVDGETARALAGGTPRVRLPERVALRLAGLRWRWGMAATPPALLPYTVHPWVVANDRLKADGWSPTASNEEAIVASHQAGPWATLSPRRRQELALAASGLVLAGAVTGVVALIRRRARRSR
jgi:nucleoside-diphosphate-sugar epimerase